MPLDEDSKCLDGRVPESSNRVRQFSGVCGLVGALLFFGGDMLFYGYLGPGSGFAEGMRTTVIHASEERLFAGGLIGPIAAGLCIVGFWHVYLNMHRSPALLRKLTFGVFFALMVAGSAVHTLWTAKGLTLKYCYDQSGACPQLLAAVKSYWGIAYNLSAVPGYIGAMLLAVLVLMGKTCYPRWTVLLNPGVLIVSLSYFAGFVPSPLGAILVGGVTNLSIAAFFLTSIFTTWRLPQSPSS